MAAPPPGVRDALGGAAGGERHPPRVAARHKEGSCTVTVRDPFSAAGSGRVPPGSRRSDSESLKSLHWARVPGRGCQAALGALQRV